MSDDPVLKMYETQAELEKMKDEMREIQKQNSQLKNEIAFKNVLETVNGFQSKLDVLSTNVKEIQQAFAALSNRVSNHDDKFSELNQNLRKINETLTKCDVTLSQHNGILAKQNEIAQVLNTNGNNLEEQTILLLGGYDGMNDDSLLMLENNGQNWKQLKIKLPDTIINHGAQFLNNNLYIFGGGNKEVLNYTYKLSKLSKWEKMADMNQKRRNISNSNVILSNQIWVCGGRDSEDRVLKSVEMYDPETNKWKYMKEMNKCRWNAAAAVVSGKIFCCGGWTSLSECYDPCSNVWTPVCNMPQFVQGHGAVEMDGNLIVIGGNGIKHYLKNVWALNSTDGNAKWIEKPSISIPRDKFSIAKINGKILVCGGFDGNILDFVEIFDGEVWRNGPKMPTYRSGAPAVVITIEFARYLN